MSNYCHGSPDVAVIRSQPQPSETNKSPEKHSSKRKVNKPRGPKWKVNKKHDALTETNEEAAASNLKMKPAGLKTNDQKPPSPPPASKPAEPAGNECRMTNRVKLRHNCSALDKGTSR